MADIYAEVAARSKAGGHRTRVRVLFDGAGSAARMAERANAAIAEIEDAGGCVVRVGDALPEPVGSSADVSCAYVLTIVYREAS